MNEEDPKPLNLQINLQAFNVFFSLFSFPFYSEGFGGEDWGVVLQNDLIGDLGISFILTIKIV